MSRVILFITLFLVIATGSHSAMAVDTDSKLYSSDLEIDNDKQQNSSDDCDSHLEAAMIFHQRLNRDVYFSDMTPFSLRRKNIYYSSRAPPLA